MTNNNWHTSKKIQTRVNCGTINQTRLIVWYFSTILHLVCFFYSTNIRVSMALFKMAPYKIRMQKNPSLGVQTFWLYPCCFGRVRQNATFPLCKKRFRMAKNYLKCISFIFVIEQLLQSNFPVWKSKYDSWNTFFSLTFIYSSINLCS